MTQDRRKDENRPTEALVFTDAALIAAGLAHLEAEKAAACLVHAKDDLWVGVGTKGALRGLLSEDTASQSQAVPSELASLQRYDHLGCLMTPDQTGDYYLVSDVQSLFSHSTATGKARPTDDELWDETIRDRDQYHEWADKLAEAISKHFGVYIGEHSNTNCPWAEALEAIENAEPGAATGKVPTDEEVAAICVNVRPDDYQDEYGLEFLRYDGAVVRAWLAASPAAPLAAVPAEEAKAAPEMVSGEMVSDVVENLREYASNAGYSHSDYADTMREAADIIEKMGPNSTTNISVPPPPPAPPTRYVCDSVKPNIKTNAQRASHSIDTPEFRQLVAKVWQMPTIGGRDTKIKPLIDYINRHIAAQAPAGRDAIRDEALEEAAKACEGEQVESTGTDGDTGYNTAIQHCAAAIRVLKSHAAEQASGGAK